MATAISTYTFTKKIHLRPKIPSQQQKLQQIITKQPTNVVYYID
jgi:hypothetical protein